MDDQTIHDALRAKLESGEITQEEYEHLTKDLERLNLLGAKRTESNPKEHVYSTISVNGSKTLETGLVEGSTSVNGKLKVKSDLTTKDLRVNGKVDIGGSLEVKNSASISGKVDVAENATFSNGIKVSGKVEVGNQLVLGSDSKISGKLIAKGEILGDGTLTVLGKIYGKQIRHSGTITSLGPIVVAEDIVAQQFVSRAGGGETGGSIRAKAVSIGEEYMKHSVSKENLSADQIQNFAQLAKYLTNVIHRAVSSTTFHGPPRVFSVGGSVEGDSINLAYAHVKGDVVGDNVVIDSDVIVEGTIKYRNSIQVPEGSEYRIEQIATA